MKKYNPIEALTKIKVLINKFYENIGRESEEDGYTLSIQASDLIEKIDIIVKKSDIPKKNLIIENLE